jgi:phage-related tail fiber protein
MSRTKSIKFPNTMSEMSNLFDKLQRALSAVCLNSAGLTIGSSSKPKVKIANTTYAYVEGVIAKKTTAEIVIAGTVTNAKFNVFVLGIDSAAAVTATAGTQAATLAGVAFPALPDGSAMIGFVIVNPTGTGDFVGGTNDLDDATIVPNAVYVNTPYPFLPALETL